MLQKNSLTPPPSVMNIGRLSSLHGDDNGLGNSGSKVTAKPKSQAPDGCAASINLPGQLGILGKVRRFGSDWFNDQFFLEWQTGS